jgi:hypothetical protein
MHIVSDTTQSANITAIQSSAGPPLYLRSYHPVHTPLQIYMHARVQQVLHTGVPCMQEFSKYCTPDLFARVYVCTADLYIWLHSYLSWSTSVPAIKGCCIDCTIYKSVCEYADGNVYTYPGTAVVQWLHRYACINNFYCTW